jgi:hypothetical protein
MLFDLNTKCGFFTQILLGIILASLLAFPLFYLKNKDVKADKPKPEVSQYVENPYPESHIKEFQYKGHDYIQFWSSVVHNPDCKKCNQSIDK